MCVIVISWTHVLNHEIPQLSNFPKTVLFLEIDTYVCTFQIQAHHWEMSNLKLISKFHSLKEQQTPSLLMQSQLIKLLMYVITDG